MDVMHGDTGLVFMWVMYVLYADEKQVFTQWVKTANKSSKLTHLKIKTIFWSYTAMI